LFSIRSPACPIAESRVLSATLQAGTVVVDKTLESQIVGLDQLLAESEKQAKALLARVRGLRRKTNAGELASLAGLFDPLPRQIEQLAVALQAARDSLSYDAAAALSDGSYLAELQAEARAQDVVVTERDGRLTAFPLLLKLEARIPAVRIGRKLERGIRPSFLVRRLRQAQAASRFDAARFLGQVFNAYAYLAPRAQPGWQASKAGDGPVVPLNAIHALLTLHPAAAAEYPREAFACDLLRLNRAPDTSTGGGHRFTLPASTGSKGRNRLTVFDEHGTEHVYVGVRFSREAAPLGDDDVDHA
jgi:hypothetical protein